MKANIEQPANEMAQKGYFWDSVFFDNEAGIEYLYIVLKSGDFSKIMVDESNLIPTPFRDIYEKFRNECWVPEPYADIEFLQCFNSEMQFGLSE